MKRSVGRVVGCGPVVACVVALAICGTAFAAGPSPLDAAISRGDIDAVRTLISQKVDVNAADATGTAPLHHAARAGRTDIARLLLLAGANVTAANRYGVTPLQLAAENGDAALATLLLEAGADPNATLPGGETVLMTAARTGRADVLTQLLDRGANVQAREALYGETALMWAAAENHPEAVRLLVARGASVDSRSETQAFSKRRSGQSVLSLGSWTPLMYAARQNALDAGLALAAAGADLNLVDPDGATALVIAIINANYAFAAWLLDAGADPNVVDTEAGMGPLYAAIDMHRLAVGHGRPNPRVGGEIDAVEVVRRVLARKANPNATLRAPIMQRQHTFGDGSLGKGATPLMRAAKSGEVDVMKLLLAAGADPFATMPNGATTLMFAAGLGWRDGSPAAPSYDQGTAEDATRAIDVLVGLGVPINASTAQGDTTLHVATTGRGVPLIVKHLIAKGADLGAKNKRGQTPLDAAKGSRKDLSALVAILSEATQATGPRR